MPQYETTLSQDIKDANLEHLLGTGKGSIDISGYIPEIYDSEQSMRQAIEVISRFIHQKDIGKSSPEFITALRQKTQPLELITALEKTNVTSALHAMLEFGTNKQKEYLVQRLHTYSSLIREGTPQARAVESIFMGEGTVQPESVLVGIWREIVHACMLDTPELQALEIARKLTNRLNNAKRRAAIHISRDDFEKHYHHSYLSYDGVDSTNPTDLVPKKEPEITPLSNNLPTFHGSMSRMYPKMEQRKGEVVEANANVATSLIDTYQRIFNKINKKYPNLQEFQKQRHAVFELARVIAKSTELVEPFRTSGSSKRCSFAEQLAWARLDTQVQAQLRGILQKIDGSYLGGIDRFIGKSGNNPYESMFRKITKFKSSVDKEEITATEDFAKRYRQYFIDTYAERFEAEEDKLVSALPSAKFESLDAIEAMDDNEVTELFAEELEYISRKRNRRASLAQKAIDLRFKDDVYRIDWINQAPFGLIKRTHRMFAVGVSKDAALAYAVTEYCFPNHSTDRELIEVCSKLSSDQVRVTRKLSNLLIRLNVEATPNEVIAIAQASEDEDLVKIEQLLTIGFTIADLLKYPWLQKLEVNEAESFPAKGQENSKQRWVADHSYAYLNGGWNKNTLGKIILTRLDARIERSIHDASQWLESFQIPEFSYDIKAIKENLPGNVPPPPTQVGDGEPEGWRETIRLHDESQEHLLLAAILQSPKELRDRLLLPGKPQKIQTLFFQPENQLLYQTLLPLYKEDTFNISSWRQAALENVAAFYTDWLVNAHGKDTTFKISIEELSQKVNTTLDAVTAIATPENTKVTEIIRTLNEYGIKRTEYIHDASSWLLQHVTTSSARLSKIWSDRGRALLEGVSDNPGDIAHWQDQNALRMYLDELQSKQKMPKNLTRAEIITRYRPWADELSRVYPAKIVVEAISKFKEESQDVEKKLLPPRTIQIQRGKDSFKLEVLAQDDPRGLTIGIDTGCCMHYEGASNSCIWSGYVDPGAGFLALYAPDGKLIAQSYFYTNDRHPDTLVLDNIEATQGRDTGAIVSLYIEGLKQYLEWRYASDKDWKIRIVNVGTGYGDAVKKTVTTLPQAKHVPNTPYIYTDAKDQRILLSVSDEEITTWRSEPIPAAAETVKPIHTPELERRNIYHFYRPERVISGLEAQIYPEHIRQYTDPETVEEELKMPKAGQYSSLYFEKIDASEELVAYLIAYEARSESKYRQRKPVLYIADLAILPNSQHKGVGTKMLDDFLSMVTKNGVYKKIEMHARASTSYPALQSESAQTLLKKHGYVFKDHGVVDSFEDDDGQLEKLYLVSLTKIELPPEEIAAQTLIETPTPDLPSLEVNTDQASPEINETDLPSEDEIAAQIEELTTFELPDAE